MPELTCPVLVNGVQCARDLHEKAKYKAGIFNTIVYECDRGHLSRFLYQPVKAIRCVYRRLTDSMFWHFCDNCTDWPKKNYIEVESPEHPPAGGFCLQCIRKRKDGDCSGWNVGPD